MTDNDNLIVPDAGEGEEATPAAPGASPDTRPPTPGTRLIRVDPEKDPLLARYALGQVSQVTLVPDDHPLLTAHLQDQARMDIWVGANDELRRVIAEVAGWFVNEYRLTILRRYELAELIRGLDDDHAGGRECRYGKRAIKKLERFFGWDDGVLYGALRLARAYTREEVERLSRLRMRNGGPLGYKHLELLSGVDDPREREAALRMALDGSWGTRELDCHIHGLPKRPAPPGQGRPMAVPRDLDALLHQQSRSADDFLARSQKVWGQPEQSMSRRVRDLSYEEVTEGRAEGLLAHARKMRLLAHEAVKRADDAEQAHLHALAALEKQRAGAGHQAATELARA